MSIFGFLNSKIRFTSINLVDPSKNTRKLRNYVFFEKCHQSSGFLTQNQIHCRLMAVFFHFLSQIHNRLMSFFGKNFDFFLPKTDFLVQTRLMQCFFFTIHHQIHTRLIVFFGKFLYFFSPRKRIFWSKSLKKLKVQKWCQNGSNSII